ncbi:MAG: 4'-phosphopantetheinyl transferase superfamily protein, partial [Candidatus Sericytochromatia bacterium]|nr:4'-phosphopantetheinyl transferase superfamily protein [Candidatus Sericytochromatia bacterium]
IAERFFSDYERKSLNSIPETLQKEAFFNGWTRKEAYIKLKGKGLSIPLNSFDVSIIPEQNPLLIDSRDDDIHFSNWKVFDIKTFEGYKAALITDKSVILINYHTF